MKNENEKAVCGNFAHCFYSDDYKGNKNLCSRLNTFCRDFISHSSGGDFRKFSDDHHVSQDIGHKASFLVAHFSSNGNGRAAAVSDFARDADRFSRRYRTDEIHRQRNCCNNSAYGCACHACNGISKRCKNASMNDASLIVMLFWVSLKADRCASAVNLFNVDMEVIHHEMIGLVDISDVLPDLLWVC